MVSSPHPIPCIESSYGKDRSTELSRGSVGSDGAGFRVPGNYVKGIACGGRHSAVITGMFFWCSFYLVEYEEQTKFAQDYFEGQFDLQL